MMFQTTGPGSSRPQTLIWVALISLSARLACSPVEAAEGAVSCSAASTLEQQVTPRDAVIAGIEGTQVQIYRTHPSQCVGGTNHTCQGTDYLFPGDGVQITRFCGGYAQVTYSTDSRLSTGWVKETALQGPRVDISDAKPSKVTASSMHDLPAFLEGSYSTPAQRCVRLDENLEPVPCDSQERDCMVIKKVDERHARFDVYSPQVNGSICAVDGVAELVGTELVYRDQDPSSPTAGAQLRFDVLQGEVVLRTFGGPHSALEPFCGHDGRLDQITFPLNDRRELKQQTSCPVQGH